MLRCPDSSLLENWPIALALRHPIPILVLICRLRTSPWAESIGKRLFAKWMTYTHSYYSLVVNVTTESTLSGFGICTIGGAHSDVSIFCRTLSFSSFYQSLLLPFPSCSGELVWVCKTWGCGISLKVGQPWITNLRVMRTDEWVMSKCTQDSQKVCTKLFSLPDNARKTQFLFLV